MENKAADPLRYEKLRTVFLGAILAVLLALLTGMILFALSLRHYEAQISNIVGRLETVSEQLEELDVEKLVSTANEVTDAVDAAKVEEIVTALRDISKELDQVDWLKIAENINTVASDAQDTLSSAQESLEKYKELDIESLNQAITDLQKSVEPMAAFARLFG